MVDDILLKSVSNKKWVKKILNEVYPQIKDTPVSQFLLNNEPIFFNKDNTNLYLTTWKEQPLFLEEFKNDMLSLDSIKYFRNNSFFKNIKSSSISYNNISKYNKSISAKKNFVGRARLLKTLTINKDTGDVQLSGTIAYVLDMSLKIDNFDNDEIFNHYVISKLKLKKAAKGPQYQYYLSKDIYNSLLPYINNKEYSSTYNQTQDNNYVNSNQSSYNNTINVYTDANLNKDYEYHSTVGGKKEKIKHQKSLQKYTVEIDNNPTEKDKVTMHILSRKGVNGVLPFLYTNEVVTDEKARTYNDVCDMVEANVSKIEDNLYSEMFGKILKYNRNNLGNIYNSDEAGDYSENKDELNVKQLKIATASLQDRTKLRRISIKVCDCYLDAMEKAKQKIFNKPYEDSEGLNYNLHLYLVEVLSPLVVCACSPNCDWQETLPDSGLKAFKKHVGVDESTPDFTANSYISFPEASNFPLADSVLFINGVRTYISTKGGAKAEGANPSIKSLNEFVYGENGKILTYLAETVKKKYPNEFSVFEELLKGTVSSLNFSKISSAIGCTNVFELEKWLRLNQDIITEIVMTILQAQSFQFMQVKCKATSATENFNFNYKIQYPAVFKGDVEIILDKNTIRFHIE